MNTFRVAFFLAWRQILRTNRKSALMIIAVMTLTFLNLIAVSGILVGLIEGSSMQYRQKFSGDLVISNFENEKNIKNTEEIISVLKTLDEVDGYSPRYITPVTLESNYTNRDAGRRREIANTQVYGITPSLENRVTNWGSEIIDGEYLNDDDTNKILLGMYTIKKYSPTPNESNRVMGDVSVGDKILVTIQGKTNEFVVKGILGGKTDASRQVYIISGDFRKILGYGDTRASSINVKVKEEGQEEFVKKVLVNNNLDENQKIQTYKEAEPSFVKDLKKIFSILGTAIGAIGLVVAFITIFIVIYINAITRRKYIGIMKGIGITTKSIELSYMMQSIFYGFTGSMFGAFIVYVFLVPFFAAYPIDFPFSDGIMVAPYFDTFLKFVVLMFSTILAGYIPSRSIIKQNTLNAILGR